MTLIIFFGDSISAGQRVNPHETWVHRVSMSLSFQMPDYLMQVVATNGDTTNDALLKLKYHVIDNSPDIVFLQFGLNDANRWKSLGCNNRVPLDLYESNFRFMINSILLSKKSQVYLLTSHQVIKNHACKLSNSLRIDSKRYNQIIRNIATEYHPFCTLVDFEYLSQLWPNEYLLQDGIHLSKLGHELYFEEIQKILISLPENQ